MVVIGVIVVVVVVVLVVVIAIVVVMMARAIVGSISRNDVIVVGLVDLTRVIKP